MRRLAATLRAAAFVAILSLAAAACGSMTPTPHVHIATQRIVDASGRMLLLRGVAVTGMIDYPADYAENPPVTAEDLGEIAALGFDYVRLPVSWSAIEPARGRFARSYLAHVDAVVRAARKRGLYVLVDMHMDRYGRELEPGQESDGAPPWATLTACQPGAPVCVQQAWQSFWSDRQGIQRQYVQALVALSNELRGERGLLGLELMNNPSTGTTPSPAFERTQLWPFWRRAIAALRGAGELRPLWLDENASAEQSGTDPAPGPFHGEDVVLAPHSYDGVFTAQQGSSSLPQWYSAAAGEAARGRMPLIVGEYGSAGGGAWDSWLIAQLDLQDQYAVGSAFWMWKQRPGFYNWQLVGLDGGLRSDSDRAQDLSRPHADAVPGRLVSESFDGGHLTVAVDGPGGTAQLWSGTQVISGAPSLLPAPLTRASVDGVSVETTLQRRAYASAAVSLLGYLVSVRVPSGRHTLTLN
jgi:endoglycosylceramidase